MCLLLIGHVFTQRFRLTLKKRYKPKRVQLAMMGKRAASLLVMVSGMSEEFYGEGEAGEEERERKKMEWLQVTYR